MAFKKLLDNPLFKNRAPLVLRWSDDQLTPLVDRLAPRMQDHLTYQMQLVAASVARSIVVEKMITGSGVHAVCPSQEPDRLAATAPGRRAMLKHYERLVDPDGVLSPKECSKLAANARKAQLAEAQAQSPEARQRAQGIPSRGRGCAGAGMTDTQTPVPTDATAHREAHRYQFVCRCGLGWNGLKTCHCATCHCTFSVVAAFHKHRRGTYEPDARHCVNPTDAGLVLIARDYACWGRAYSE